MRLINVDINYTRFQEMMLSVSHASTFNFVDTVGHHFDPYLRWKIYYHNYNHHDTLINSLAILVSRILVNRISSS